MVPTSLMLIVSGIVCILLTFYAIRQIRPRAGEPEAAWTASDALSTTVILVLMTLFIAGVGLILKGILD